jgi:hypothetical protein
MKAETDEGIIGDDQEDGEEDERQS